MDWILDADVFTRRTHCGPGWVEHPWLVDLALFANAVIFLCYMTIPFLVAVMFERVRDGWRPRRPTLGLSLAGAFVLTCGITHALDAYMFIIPVYRLTCVALAVCATCSAAFVSWCLWETLASHGGTHGR